MKAYVLMTVVCIIFFSANLVFGQEGNLSMASFPQRIGNFIGGASPYVIIGLGILLIFIQKLAKFIGIILLIIGMARLILFFIH